MLSESSFHLGNLPSDVIRKIICIEQESINYLRLISPRWNSLALEHFTYRKNLPAIQQLYIAVDPRGKASLDLHVSERYLDYFGIRKRCSADGNDNDRIEYFESSGNFIPGVALKLSNVVRRLAGRSSRTETNLSKLLTKLVHRCSIIDELTVNMDVNKREDELNIIKRSMDGATITELHLVGLVNFNKKSATILRDILIAHPVQRLVVSARNTTIEGGLFDTLKHLYMDSAHLVETSKFVMFAKVKIDEYLAALDEGERANIRRNSNVTFFVEVNFTAVLAAGKAPDVKCYSWDFF